MPHIGFLSGLLISMYWRDHNPPHIHVYKGDYELVMDIMTLQARGTLPSKDIRRVEKWVKDHREELLDNWDRASRHESLNFIK